VPAKRYEMFYGDSGTGKSEGAARVAKLVAESMGLRARILVGDGSARTYEAAGLVDAGIADILDYTGRKYPQSTAMQLLEGYWPEDPNDPDSPLLPPSTLAKSNSNNLSEFGVYIVEGAAVMSNYLMGDQVGGYAYRAARGEKIGMDTPIRVGDGEYKTVAGKQVFVPAFEGAMEFGTNNPAHYGFAQGRMKTILNRGKILPMEYVIWTSHQRVVEDKLSKELVAGPEVAGEAITTKLQRDFHNTWHFDNPQARARATATDAVTAQKVDSIKGEYRVYPTDHYSANSNITVKFKAVTRGASAKDLKDYYTGEPGDAVEEIYMHLKKLGAERARASGALFEAAKAKRVAA
jgi:hypothetical protein